MRVGEPRKNEYGTPVYDMVCETCGREYSITTGCTPEEVDRPGWENCLAPDCKSYDIDRDLDLLFVDNETELDRPRQGGVN